MIPSGECLEDIQMSEPPAVGMARRVEAKDMFLATQNSLE